MALHDSHFFERIYKNILFLLKMYVEIKQIRKSNRLAYEEIQKKYLPKDFFGAKKEKKN